MLPLDFLLFAVAIGLAVAFLSRFVLAPIRIWRTISQPANPHYERCDSNDLGGDVVTTIADVEELGFAVRGHWMLASSRTNGQITLLEHPRTLDIAKILVVQSRTRRHLTLLFQTRFDDGSEVVSANNQVTAGLPSLPDVTVLWLPEVHEAAALYRVHCQLRDNIGGAKKRVAIGDDPLAFLVEGTNRMHSHFVTTGYYYLDELSERYRLTWKGAWLMSWRLLWPGRNLFRAGRRRRTDRLIRDLGIQLDRE